MRYNKIEFRWSKTNNKYELVKWYEEDDGVECCYVIAFFEKHDEGYDVRTVGNRFFDEGWDAFLVAQSAMNFLESICDHEAAKNI